MLRFITVKVIKKKKKDNCKLLALSKIKKKEKDLLIWAIG